MFVLDTLNKHCFNIAGFYYYLFSLTKSRFLFCRTVDPKRLWNKDYTFMFVTFKLQYNEDENLSSILDYFFASYYHIQIPQKKKKIKLKNSI